jgi:hypothetical protein
MENSYLSKPKWKLDSVLVSHTVSNYDTKSHSSINISHPIMVTKHTDGFSMTSRQMTILSFTHEMTKIKQTKITKNNKKS